MSGVRKGLDRLLVSFKRQFGRHLPNADGPGTVARMGGTKELGHRGWTEHR